MLDKCRQETLAELTGDENGNFVTDGSIVVGFRDEEWRPLSATHIKRTAVPR